MGETYGTYVDNACFDIHDYDADTDHDTIDDTNTEDDTDDGGWGNLYTIAYNEKLFLDLVRPWMSILEELWTWY